MFHLETSRANINSMLTKFRVEPKSGTGLSVNQKNHAKQDALHGFFLSSHFRTKDKIIQPETSKKQILVQEIKNPLKFL